jgi:hypothetical protein
LRALPVARGRSRLAPRPDPLKLLLRGRCVASRSRRAIEGCKGSLLQGDALTAVRQFKEQDGSHLCGGPRTSAGSPPAMLSPPAQGCSASAVPPSRGLAVAGQVLLVVGGQLAGVVGLPPHRQLREVGHHPAAALPPWLAPAPVVDCSPQKMVWDESRPEGRRAKGDSEE